MRLPCRFLASNLQHTFSGHAPDNVWVAADTANTFVQGWKLYPSQLVDLLTKGNVQ